MTQKYIPWSEEWGDTADEGFVIVREALDGTHYSFSDLGEHWVMHKNAAFAWIYDKQPDTSGWKRQPTGRFPARWSESTGTEITGPLEPYAELREKDRP